MSYLAKPTQFYYVAPDIMNFPTANKEMSDDFNFTSEMFKFLPKMQQLAFEGKMVADDSDTTSHNVAGLNVTDEWYQALNEYSIPANLQSAVYGDPNCDTDSSVNWKPVDNEQAMTMSDNGQNPTGWSWNGNMVSGIVHFNEGFSLTAQDYFWGQEVGAGLSNVDFEATANQWNHLEEKKSLGLQALAQQNGGMPIDHSLDADVNQSYFVGDFLHGIGLNWDQLNGVLNNFSNQSYYEIVMNSTKSDNTNYPSYTMLSPKDMVLLIAAMIESRNRVYSIAQKVLGPVADTWNDQEMMQNFSAWLDAHKTEGLSHGVNAFRILLETSHMLLNQIGMFTKTSNDPNACYSMSMLDRYAFTQFNKACGSDYFNAFNGAGGDASNAGAIFSYISSCLGHNLTTDEANYLCQPLTTPFSFDTTVSQVPLPQGMDPRLQAFKWLVEQWFGSNRTNSAAYNGMPKAVYLRPSIDFNDNKQVSDMFGAKVSNSTFDPNGIRSYGWDRVAGPFDPYSEGDAFLNSDGSAWIQGQDWYNVYNAIRNGHPNSLGYISPAVVGDDHETFMRRQFTGLNQREIMGQGGNIVPYSNSWAVYEEGNLLLHGQATDTIRMNLFDFMNTMETNRYNRAEDKYENDLDDQKEQEADYDKEIDKIQSSHRNEEKRMQKQSEQANQKKQAEMNKASKVKKPHKNQ